VTAAVWDVVAIDRASGGRDIGALHRSIIRGILQHGGRLATQRTSGHSAEPGTAGAVRPPSRVWAGPEHAWAAYLLSRGEAGALNGVDALLADATGPRRPLRTDAWSRRPIWLTPSLRAMADDVGCLVPAAPQDRVPSDAESRVNDALALLQNAWPDYWSESQQLVFDIVPIAGLRITSTTLPRAFGAIFVRVEHETTVLDVLDSIVHEQAHHRLFVGTACHPPMSDPGRMGYSPLRKVERPAIMVVHATFVSARLAELFRRASEYGDRRFARDCNARLCHYRSAAADGISSLLHLGDGIWTAVGHQLFFELQVATRQLVEATV